MLMQSTSSSLLQSHFWTCGRSVIVFKYVGRWPPTFYAKKKNKLWTSGCSSTSCRVNLSCIWEWLMPPMDTYGDLGKLFVLVLPTYPHSHIFQPSLCCFRRPRQRRVQVTGARAVARAPRCAKGHRWCGGQRAMPRSAWLSGHCG